jgi:ribose 5-phosphate isomerase RpiB
MDIPLLSREDVEKEGEGVGISIRDEIVEFLQSRGYKYAPSGDDLGNETNDFFTKDDQFVQVIINNEIPDEILEQMDKK